MTKKIHDPTKGGTCYGNVLGGREGGDKKDIKVLISREEVLQAIKGHPNQDGIMLYIDTILDDCKLNKHALELACLSKVGHVMSPSESFRIRDNYIDLYLTQAKEKKEL